MYATPLDFLYQFGVKFSAEFLDRSDGNHLTPDCISEAFEIVNAGGLPRNISYIRGCTQEDKASAFAAIVLTKHHLNDAYSEINSYLIARYQLPIDQLAIDQSPLKRITCDITRYLIANTSDMASELIDQRYKDAIKWLKEVSNGKAQLSISGQISTDKANSTAGIGFATGSKVKTEGY